MKNKSCLFLIILFMSASLIAQEKIGSYTRQDTLRGSITQERKWWDLKFYSLKIKVDPDKCFISGSNKIVYRVLRPDSVLQIDLQHPMQITEIEQNGEVLPFWQDGNVWYVKTRHFQKKDEVFSINIEFSGKPKVSENPPWSGGITWQKDGAGNSFIATSCQGDGASLWWPCKDHMYDEPDSMAISINVPQNLIALSNGRLGDIISNNDSSKTFEWFVANPINNYGVNMNIGNYVSYSEKYEGLNGLLDCSYYVLPENLNKAKEHFKQVPLMLKAFEYWFGPYPFYEDGYKLVEVPYLGMEHQSSVTYGNKYINGYLGDDLSGTGWGKTFDFIIIHESGHEWFGNSITYKDIADMWIHESFTAYAEGLYVEYYNGKKAGAEYTIGTRERILNDKPIIGKYDVNNSGSGDMYYKGANMLHMIRQMVNNDAKWHAILLEMNKRYYHQMVDTKQIEKFMKVKTGIKLKPVFDQYLRDIRIPEFEYHITTKKLYYRWNNCVDNFKMPLKIFINEKEKWIYPDKSWKTMRTETSKPEIKVDPNFYVSKKKTIQE